MDIYPNNTKSSILRKIKCTPLLTLIRIYFITVITYNSQKICKLYSTTEQPLLYIHRLIYLFFS